MVPVTNSMSALNWKTLPERLQGKINTLSRKLLPEGAAGQEKSIKLEILARGAARQEKYTKQENNTLKLSFRYRVEDRCAEGIILMV